MDRVITLTSVAAQKIKAFIQNEGYGTQSTGIGVKAQEDANGRIIYDLELVDIHGKDHLIVEEKGVRLYLDPDSAKHLEGSKIDYINTDDGSGFVIINPNVSCGCGPDCGCQSGKKK